MANKYRAVKVKADGYTFDSKAEYRRYCELRLLEKAGRIMHVQCHQRYPLYAFGKYGGNEKVGEYECDFSYLRDGVKVIEDVKGVRTAVYRLKAKLFEANYGFAITEVKMR